MSIHQKQHACVLRVVYCEGNRSHFTHACRRFQEPNSQGPAITLIDMQTFRIICKTHH